VDLHHLLLAGLPAHLCKNVEDCKRRRMILRNARCRPRSMERSDRMASIGGIGLR
jgi:hypothetical protein